MSLYTGNIITHLDAVVAANVEHTLSFSFDFEPNGIQYGSKLKGKLSPRSYPIKCERKLKYSPKATRHAPKGSVQERNCLFSFN